MFDYINILITAGGRREERGKKKEKEKREMIPSNISLFFLHAASIMRYISE